MGVRKTVFVVLGYIYRLLFLLPVVGEPMVRGICRAIAFVNYNSPYGMKSCASIGELRKEFERLVRMADIDVRITAQDEDRLEILVPRCPYGFSGPRHAGVCDAAMDMDRKMFRYCGAELVVDECIPDGFSACLISIHLERSTG